MTLSSSFVLPSFHCSYFLAYASSRTAHITEERCASTDNHPFRRPKLTKRLGVGCSSIHPLTRHWHSFPSSFPPILAINPLSGGSDLDALRDAIGLARVDLLARLGDGREHLLVGQVVLGHDGGGLALEGDLVRLDAYGDGAWLATCFLGQCLCISVVSPRRLQRRARAMARIGLGIGWRSAYPRAS